MYKLEYLPIALQDMVDIVKYISDDLKNPVAAERLAGKLTESAENLKQFPYSNSVYVLIKPLKYEYRKLIVENHLILYTVDEENKTVTIMRVVYARRNYEKLL